MVEFQSKNGNQGQEEDKDDAEPLDFADQFYDSDEKSCP